MSFRSLLRPRAIAPVTAALTAASIVLYPRTTLHAETVEQLPAKKPIYDNDEALPPTTSNLYTLPTETTTPPPTSPKRASPTPIDRLAVQVSKSRMFIHAHVAAAETRVNSLMDSILHLENSFTGTIASLAPPPQSGEKLMPGTLYVLVAAMTGSIISRNRNIVLRGVVPLAVGIGAGWVVLPYTMRNISELLWKYEERFPAVTDGHLRTKQSLQRAWEMTRVHTKLALETVDERVGESREAIEGWVKKGK